MASLENRKDGGYRIVFRHSGRKFSRSLATKSERTAKAALARFEDNLHRLKIGTLTIPQGADLVTFLLSDGTLHQSPKSLSVVTLSELLDSYKNDLPDNSIEENTRKMIEIHIRHLERLIGERTHVQAIDQKKIQEYINDRSKERGRNGTVDTVTIKKELATLKSIWRWANAGNLIEHSFPASQLKFAKTRQRSPFQTMEQIERRIARGGLSSQDIHELWECLFLSMEQINELLQHVKSVAKHGFIFPAFCAAAFTGARRSELLRSEVDDICFETGTISIREKKRVRGQNSTRTVPMSQTLSSVLHEWIENHPGGKYTFCLDPPSRSELTPNQAVDYFKRSLTGSKYEVVRGWHCFRHSFCSNCAAAGLDQRQINGFVGHQSDEIVRRYRHLFPNRQKAALSRVFE